MPAANPLNRNLSTKFQWPNPYSGNKSLGDRLAGFVWSPGDSRTQVLDDVRAYEVLEVSFANPTIDPNGIAQPLFGQLWSSFLDSSGKPSWGAATRNQAYSRFKNKAVGETSALGVLAGERRQAYGMMANRALGLYKGVRSLRKGDFRGFLNDISANPKRKHRNKIAVGADEASRIFLEYHFGWAPTVSELYGFTETLTKELPAGRYSGSAKLTRTEEETFQSLFNTATGTYRVRTGATVILTNPDMFLLQSMGLANPVSVLNELTPFSFVLEWFVKYGAVVDALTDFVGCSLSDGWQSYRLEKVVRFGRWFDPGVRYSSVRSSGLGFGFFRDQNILQPTVVFPQWLDIWRPKARAASAVSLLTQALLSLKH